MSTDRISELQLVDRFFLFSWQQYILHNEMGLDFFQTS